MSGDKPVHDWRECIISSDLPPTTRHVLLTLSLHMDIWGESCYPTIAQLVYETGLSRSCVITHLARAAELGWLEKYQHGFGGQEWRNHEYRATKPEGAKATAWKHSEQYLKKHKGGPARGPAKPPKGGPVDGPRKPKGGPRDEPRLQEGGPPDDKGGPPGGPKVVHEVDPSIPVQYPNKYPTTDCGQASPAAAPKTGKSADVWLAYSDAYQHRYGTRPIRDASVNSMLCKLVDSVGADDAPGLAGYYVTHNDRYYVLQRHPVSLLLKDRQRLLTDWKTGQQMTSTQAGQIDRTQNNYSVVQAVIAKRQAEGKM